MGIQNPQTINLNLKRNPISGNVESGYISMPSQYRLAAGRYDPEVYPMELVYPRSNSETSAYSYHRIWQTGEPLDIPVRAMWGAFPHVYRILSAPSGWSIGEWLVVDAFGDLVPNDAYGTLSNANPSAGTHNIVVGILDAAGSLVRASFTISVGNNGFFAAPTATGNGSGSDANNCMALSDAHLAGEAASPSAQKILFLRGGTYNWSGDFILNANKSIAVVNYRNEAPNITNSVVGAQFRLKTNDTFVKGITLTGWGDSAVFRTDNSFYSRQVVWRCTIVDAMGRPGSANNEAGWFVDSTQNSTKRPYFMFSEINFINCHECSAFDWYSVKGIMERMTWTTNKTTIEEPIYFPKASCEYDMRWLNYNNTTATSADNNQGVLMPYNSETLSRVKAQMRFNFIKTHPSVSCVVWNGASNPGTEFPADGYDSRNTYIGGKVVSRDYGGDLITYTNDVMQNSNSGPLPTSTGYVVSGGSLGSSSIVDADGRLVNSANRGLHGHQIYGG